jgi:hypothetical protein
MFLSRSDCNLSPYNNILSLREHALGQKYKLFKKWLFFLEIAITPPNRPQAIDW